MIDAKIKITSTCIIYFLIFTYALGEEQKTLSPLENEPARVLAAEAYCGSTECLKWFEPVPPSPQFEPFFLFEGLGPSAGAFGYFAVNRWSGDVWNLWDCKKISTPLSRKTKDEFQNQFKAEDLKKYGKLMAALPDCT
jgi:hypothetical protein